MEILLIAVALLVGAAAGFFVGKNVLESRLRASRATAEDEAERIRGAAVLDAETLRKAEVLKGREEAIRAREELRRLREEIAQRTADLAAILEEAGEDDAAKRPRGTPRRG